MPPGLPRPVRSTPFPGFGGAGDPPRAGPAPGAAGFSRSTAHGREKYLDLASSLAHLDADGVMRLVGRRDVGPLHEFLPSSILQHHARLEVARFEAPEGEHQIGPSIGGHVERLGVADAVLAN